MEGYHLVLSFRKKNSLILKALPKSERSLLLAGWHTFSWPITLGTQIQRMAKPPRPVDTSAWARPELWEICFASKVQTVLFFHRFVGQQERTSMSLWFFHIFPTYPKKNDALRFGSQLTLRGINLSWARRLWLQGLPWAPDVAGLVLGMLSWTGKTWVNLGKTWKI